jgi:hypothetical protein
MSFIVKNSELTNDTISAINNLIDTDIDAKCAFRLTRIIKELSSILDDKSKLEKKIVDKYTQKDENGNPLPVKNENGEVVEGAVNITNTNDFQSEINGLMDIENEIPYDKIDFEDLKLETAKVKDLIKLEFLFL